MPPGPLFLLVVVLMFGPNFSAEFCAVPPVSGCRFEVIVLQFTVIWGVDVFSFGAPKVSFGTPLASSGTSGDHDFRIEW